MKHWKKKPWVDSEVRNWDYIADHLAPDASSADAGKVLTVGETGKPEWGEGGGSGGNTALIVTGSYDQTTYTTTLDKTVSEIMNALNSGTLVLYVHEYTNDNPYAMATIIFRVTYESETYWVYIYDPLVSSETGYVTFFADTLDSYPVDNE